MKKVRTPSKGVSIAWREEPRDEHGALKPFPKKEDFIQKLRATNRPTTRDLRKLRALKKTRPMLEPL
ncbi:hypothetical protein sos41_10050 [Alphaproteobacteria bacterium SO-S41]|nr:hypothetical protein sos41_10050 [Alphaproteobacteria bacterium SO-S41]